MFRLVLLIGLAASLVSLAAFRGADPFFQERPFPVNSSIAYFFLSEGRLAPDAADQQVALEVDTLSQTRILLLNYSAYDSVYANKIHRIIQRQMPMSTVSEFWDGTGEDLLAALSNQDVVVLPYPYTGQNAVLKTYGKVLNQFVKQGGGVILTGTHEYGILQQYGLFDLDFGYYCKEMAIHGSTVDHPVWSGVNEYFTPRNFAYPLDISDPNFVSLADIGGYPVMGYKNIGRGKIVYLGVEYYYEEQESARILGNAIRWLTPTGFSGGSNTAGMNFAPKFKKRSEETLYAGGSVSRQEPAAAEFDLKVYPNPYVSKGSLDINLFKPTTVAVDMTDETGRVVAVLLPRKSLNTGMYRVELPNVAPGVYFIQCQMGDVTTVKKVVKSVGN